MAEQNKQNSKFNLSIAPLWMTKSGNLASITVNDQTLEALKNVKPGGKIIVKYLPEERRRNQDSPNAYLEFMTKEHMDEFKRKRQEAEKSNPENDDV